MEFDKRKLYFLAIVAAKFTPASIFTFFGIFMILHLLWAIFIVPETKGKQLEKIKL